MVIDLDELPPVMWTVDIPMVQRITRPEEIDAMIAMENEVWNPDLSRFGRRLKRDLVETADRVNIFAVFDEKQVVSAAWSFHLVHTSFVGLYGGSTRKEFRKRVYYHALLAVRAREARQKGYRYLYVDAGPESQPILAKAGFRCLGYSTSYD